MTSEQSGAWQLWHTALASGKVHHAWLLAGPKGTGKAAFAHKAAKELVAQGTGAAADFHPDIILMQRESKNASETKKAEEEPAELRRNITVTQVRAMQQKLTTRPASGEYRAIIINPADDMEVGAANALLKSLEEPPSGTVFLLVAHNPARLLPTVRSRCRVLRFDRTMPRIGEGEIEAELTKAVASLAEAKNGDTSLLRQFIAALGTKPSRTRLQAALTAATSRLQAGLLTPQPHFAAIDDALAEMRRLEGELASFNYDPDLLTMRIGGLLSGLAAPIDRRDG